MFSHLGEGFAFDAALEEIWDLIGMANKYVEETKPWNLAKENKQEKLQGFIRLLIEVLRSVSGELSPFLSQTCASIQRQVGADEIHKGEPLFPRIDTKTNQS